LPEHEGYILLSINMAIKLTRESRSALSRARFFLNKAKACPIDERVEFEAFLEAAIVFGRAALHRMESQYEKRPGWKAWWDSLRSDPAIEFFRTERNWILKRASAKVNQKIFVGSPPNSAAEFYYFDHHRHVPATETVEEHLNNLNHRLDEGERRFAGKDGTV
jgi:hypothetical protein